MKEKTKMEHLRKNKNQGLDYVKVYDYTLRNQELKPLGNVLLYNDVKLVEVILSMSKEIENLNNKNIELENKIKELENNISKNEKLIQKIVEGKLKL